MFPAVPDFLAARVEITETPVDVAVSHYHYATPSDQERVRFAEIWPFFHFGCHVIVLLLARIHRFSSTHGYLGFIA